MKYIFDIEANGLLDEVSKIYCLAIGTVINGEYVKQIITDQEEIKKFFLQEDLILIGHNIIRYDIPVVEKIYGIKVKAKLIDTLALSWYLYNDKKSHGLEYWGKMLNIPKPYVESFSGLKKDEELIVDYVDSLGVNTNNILENIPSSSNFDISFETFKELSLKRQLNIYSSIKKKEIDLMEIYKNRCLVDIEINFHLYLFLDRYLRALYNNEPNDINRIIDYLMFKMDCAREQEEVKIKLNLPDAIALKEELEKDFIEKRDSLSKVMPTIKKYKTVSKPEKMNKKDGSLTVKGEEWKRLCSENNLPEDHSEDIQILVSEEPGNPLSNSQLKDWLFSLGWEPKTFELRKSKKEGKKMVPQISTKEKELCKSVIKLAETNPELRDLEGLFLIKNRLDIVSGYLENQKDGYIAAEIGGLTNTLRFKHKVLVNIPAPDKPYGDRIRSLFICEEDELLCGSDMSSLEDNTKQHFIYFYDPEYVKEMRVPGFDPHLDIAVQGGMLTPEQVENHKKGIENHSLVRKDAKQVNFCLPVDNTEILTKDGWKYYYDLKVGDTIFTYNRSSKCLELKPIIELPFFKDQETLRIKNQIFDFECTPNHRWWSSKRVRIKNNPHVREEFVEAKDITQDHNILRCSSWYNTESMFNDSDCKLLGWILADGWIYWSKKSDKTSSSKGNKKSVKIGISQKKHIKEVEQDLFGYKYKKYKRKDGVNIFIISANDSRELLKRLNLPKKDKKDCIFTEIILNMSYTQRELFLNSFWLADGGFHGKNKMFYQNRGNILDCLVLALTLNGYCFNITSNGIYKKNENVNLCIHNRKHITGQKLKKTSSRVTDVFCVNNENQTFIAKQGDCISITGNSAVYGVGAPTLSMNTGWTLQKSSELLEIYWKRNWAVKKIAEDCYVKSVEYLSPELIGMDGEYVDKEDVANLKVIPFIETREQKWLFNPVSKFWYFLRTEKDRFSCLNQSAGVYCFDNQVKAVRSKGIKISMQQHDEILFRLKEVDKEDVEKTLNNCIKEVNNKLKLNIELGISIDFGKTYKEVH